MKNFEPAAKRSVYVDVTDYLQEEKCRLSETEKKHLEKLDAAYRALVSVLYNFVPTSGHPGGSISSGRIVQTLLYEIMAYELAAPQRRDADILSYAAGHKALGLYALWALRNECVRISQPSLLPAQEKDQLRLEDLLGFRHNKVQGTPLFEKFRAKPLGGHPEPLTPFVLTSTGASGVGDASAAGLAFAAADTYGENCPVVNVLEGEGGLTAGRVGETLAAVSTAQLKNIVFHIDWNEASIESDRVTFDGANAGDYVQWTPAELFRIHDCNVIFVPDGHSFEQIFAAQRLALYPPNHQPTAIVYRTVKGWRYGMEGRASHGAGHKFCSPQFYQTLEEFERMFEVSFPRFEGERTPENIEKNYWDVLQVFRKALEQEKETAAFAAQRIRARAADLRMLAREERADLGNVQRIYTDFDPARPPESFRFNVGESYTTRSVLADALAYLNKQTNGCILTGSADLYGSTNAGKIAKDFPKGFFNARHNPYSRELSVGGICEDALAGICSGISSFGRHIGVWSSYAAFLAFAHVAARLHAIGYQAARETGANPNTLLLFCGHAGLPTGEDGPTHADPQALQLVQDNFPKGQSITLTPLEVDEIWPLLIRAFQLKPALLCPFVVRPSYAYMDRAALGLEPAVNAAKGVYYFMKPQGEPEGVIFVQGAGAGRIFAQEVLPKLKEQHTSLAVIYVASRELFEMLPQQEQDRLVPPSWKQIATGITDFTLPTLDGWLHSDMGRACALWPHKNGGYLGSGAASKVYEEAGMDAQGQLRAVREYLELRKKGSWR